MSDVKTTPTKQVDVDARRERDDEILGATAAELDAFEHSTGRAVDVTVADSVAGGNCEPGVIAWRKKNAGGRDSIPAREMLQLAAQNRDQISRVVLGIHRAIARATGGK